MLSCDDVLLGATQAGQVHIPPPGIHHCNHSKHQVHCDRFRANLDLWPAGNFDAERRFCDIQENICGGGRELNCRNLPRRLQSLCTEHDHATSPFLSAHGQFGGRHHHSHCSSRGFPKKTRLAKLAISLFSHPANLDSADPKSPELKVPFLVRLNDFKESASYDLRLSGFGFLFSEILVVAALLLGLTAYHFREEKKNLLRLMLVLLVLMASVFVIAEAWWARYVPQLWFIPLVILIAAEQARRRHINYLVTATYLLVVINSGGILALSSFNSFARTLRIDYQMRQFRGTDETLKADFGPFKAMRARFSEQQIPFLEGNIDEPPGVGSNGENIVMVEASHSSSKVKLKTTLDEVPKLRVILRDW